MIVFVLSILITNTTSGFDEYRGTFVYDTLESCINVRMTIKEEVDTVDDYKIIELECTQRRVYK